MSQQDQLAFAPQPDPGFGRAFMLSLLIHALLILALTWGITWRNKPQDVAVDAEIWSTIPEPVAQRKEEPAQPLPVKEPEPPPQPKPEPVKPPPQANTQPAPPDKANIEADIAINKKKKKEAEDKEKKETAEKEKKAAEQKRKDEDAKRLEDQKRKDEENKRIEDQKRKDEENKRIEDQKRKEEAKRREDEAKRREDQAKTKEEPAKTTEEEQKRLLDKKRDDEERRQEQIRRIRGEAQNATGPTEKPSAAKATTLSGNYLAKLRGRVRPNIVFPDLQMQAIKSNPEAEIEVTCSPTGQILSKKLTRSSGNKAWDEAVLNAIEKTGSLPLDENGVMQPKLSFGFKPHD